MKSIFADCMPLKKYILKLLYFIIPLLSLFFIIELGLRSIPNDYKTKNTKLSQDANHIDGLILGNSHSLYGLNPEYLEGNWYNASHISQSPSMDWAIFSKYKEDFKSLKYIVLPISYFSFYESLEKGDEAWRLKNYSLYYDIKFKNSLKNKSELLSIPIAKQFQRLYNYYVLSKNEVHINSFGWDTSYHSSKAMSLEETGRIAAKRHSIDLKNLDVYQESIDLNKKHLGLFLDWAEQHEVQVILFSPPVHKKYHSHTQEEQWQLNMNILREICEQSCIYLDFNKTNIFEDADFYDADHLSDKGAKKLTKALAERLKPLENKRL